jgi:hypothetical protein
MAGESSQPPESMLEMGRETLPIDRPGYDPSEIQPDSRRYRDVASNIQLEVGDLSTDGS